MTPEQQLALLIDGLRLLAAPAVAQVEALPDYVCVTCEVLSAFDDGYLLVDPLREAGLVDPAAAEALGAVDDPLARAPEEALDAIGLEQHPFWAEARELASAALAALGAPPGPVVLRYVTYVRGR